MTSLFIDYLKDDNNPFPSIQCPITQDNYYSPIHYYYALMTENEDIKKILRESQTYIDVFLLKKNFKDFFNHDKYESRKKEIFVINAWIKQYPDVDKENLNIFSSIIQE